MTASRDRSAILPALAACALAIASGRLIASAPVQAARSGRAVYEAGCTSCHGPDGRGQPQQIVGFAVPVPDFTDCAFSTVERTADWSAIIRYGGPVRAFDRRMPAFGDALGAPEIENVIAYIRSFCRQKRWPSGDLNLPRPLVTEKAFPENEAVATTTWDRSRPGSVETAFVYEQRLGPRSQYEVVVPFAVAQRGENGPWRQGIGDVGLAFKRVVFDEHAKGAVVSAGAEATFPTGKEAEGLGGGVTLLEPFVAYSQMLPRNGFLHVHSGFERSTNHARADDEMFVRAAGGRSFTEGRGERMWSPMIELLAARELVTGARIEWDAVPQVQITLSRRQHVMMDAGVQLPLNQREERHARLLFYVLWDWFDGGFFEGW